MKMESGSQTEMSQEALLDHLRKNTDQIKSYDEIVNLLHVIASEQKARSMLRSCMDKVLINMSDIHSLRDMLDRLRSVARTNGLRFQLVLDNNATGPETICQIIGDMFKVEITLDGQDSHFCLDVKVHHSENTRSCPEITQIIRNGKFLELSKYLKSLIEMYPLNMDRQTKTKVFLALQSLEVDVSRMSQIYNDSHPDNDVLHVVMHGAVGLIMPHVVGKSVHINYFLPPYDLIDPLSKQMITDLQYILPDKGMQAEVKIVSQDVLRTLSISPLIANNHAIDGTGQPRFAEVNQHNSVALAACFILKLHPPLPLTSMIAAEIEKETGIAVFPVKATLQSYMSLILKEESCSQVSFDDYTHRFHLDFGHLRAGMAEEIHFTHPGHIASIVALLRKQCYFNTLLTSCVRAKQTPPGAKKKEWYCDVSSDGRLTKFNITFEHPLIATSTAFAEILFSTDGFSACHLFTGRGDPPLCGDQYVTKVLQKSFSLPITMRYLMKQTKRQPRKEPEKGRHPPPRQLTLHPAAMGSYKKHPPPPLPKQNTLPAKTSTSAANAFTSPPKPTLKAELMSTMAEMQRNDNEKESLNPMLTQLLKPSNDHSVAPKLNTSVVQSKKHPMLLTLLNDPESKATPPAPPAPPPGPNPHPQQGPQPHPQSFQQQQPPNDMTHQYSQGPQPHFNQGNHPHPQTQPNTHQMPPPPSYPGMMPMKQNTQPTYQQQYQQPSPLSLDDLAPMAPSLTSPFNMTPNIPSKTPPLMPMHGIPPSPNAPSLPSPMYQPQSSPMQPPMNTPQPLPMSSPMHPAMTPPPPSPRKTSRRASRQKSLSTEVMSVGGMASVKQEIPDLGFAPQFDEAPSPMMDLFSGMSPGKGGSGFLSQQHQQHQQMVSPNGVMTNMHLPIVSSFSFDSDFGIDSNELVRKNSLNRRLSGQGPNFMQQQMMSQNMQAASHYSQDFQPQEALDGGQQGAPEMHGQFNQSYAQQQLQQHQQQQQQQYQQQQMFKQNSGQPGANSGGGKDVFGPLGGSTDSQPGDLSRSNSLHTPTATPTSLSATFSQLNEAPPEDPFTFDDDNRTPSKISMPDSSGGGANPQRSKSLSRQSSSSTVDESTLKGLLANTPGLVSALTGNSGFKQGPGKTDKPGSAMLHNLLSKNASGTSQRRSSEELSGSSFATAAQQQQQQQQQQQHQQQQQQGNLISGHKPLMRQNAISKGAPQMKPSGLPGKVGEGKEKARKRAAGKDDVTKGPPKRRGRPPSTDKKEHSVKRKKMDSASGEDGEGTRGKIVLNVQLNKGTPISSTTKTKPNAPEAAPTAGNGSGEKPSGPVPSVPQAAPGGSSAPPIEKYSPDMQRYFKTQNELEKKKKERKLGGGSASPVIPGAGKANGKFPTAPLAKSAGNGGKGLSQPPAKSQVSPQGKGAAAAPRPRRNSIKDVVEMLHAGHTSVGGSSTPKAPQAGTGAAARGTPAQTGSGVAKFTDKAPSSADHPGPPKLKPIAVQGSKLTPAAPAPHLVGGKSPTDERGIPKPASILKQGGSNKSPSHSAKLGGKAGAPVSKKDPQKPRPVTPQRDRSLATPPLTKTSPKTPSISTQEKLKSTLKYVNDAAAATAKLSGPGVDVAKQRMPGPARPAGGGKSPGRSVTPPYAKVPYPMGNPEVHIRNDSNIQNIMKNKKSPSHAGSINLTFQDAAKSTSTNSSADPSSVEGAPPMKPPPMTRPPSVNSVHPRKQPAGSDSSLNPPQPKRPNLVQQGVASNPAPRPPSAPAENPVSPDDQQLVIDDDTVGLKVNRSVTPVQASLMSRVSSPVLGLIKLQPPPSSTDGVPAPNLASIMKRSSTTDFELSPAVSGSPCVIDDALMDEAVMDTVT